MTQCFPSQIAPIVCIDFHFLMPEASLPELLPLCMAAGVPSEQNSLAWAEPAPCQPWGGSSCPSGTQPPLGDTATLQPGLVLRAAGASWAAGRGELE